VLDFRLVVGVTVGIVFGLGLALLLIVITFNALLLATRGVGLNSSVGVLQGLVAAGPHARS